jgi:hypothetical protein
MLWRGAVLVRCIAGQLRRRNFYTDREKLMGKCFPTQTVLTPTISSSERVSNVNQLLRSVRLLDPFPSVTANTAVQHAKVVAFASAL